MTRTWYGRGQTAGSFVPILNHGGIDHQLFAVWTYGSPEVYFQWYQSKMPFSDTSKRLELLKRLNCISGVSLPDSSITKRPSFPLSALQDPHCLEQFLDTFQWVVDQIKAT
jgi:hypothetical protein